MRGVFFEFYIVFYEFFWIQEMHFAQKRLNELVAEWISQPGVCKKRMGDHMKTSSKVLTTLALGFKMTWLARAFRYCDVRI